MLERPGQSDFLRSPSGPRRGWILLLLGVAACMLAALAQRAHDQRVAAQTAQAHERQAELARQREAAARVEVPTLASRRRQAAERHLAWPWLDVLRTVESATEPPVYLLALAADPGTGEVSLEAECGNFDDLTDYVRRLAAPGGFASARLTSHEWVPDPVSGGQRLRFSVLASWGQR